MSSQAFDFAVGFLNEGARQSLLTLKRRSPASLVVEMGAASRVNQEYVIILTFWNAVVAKTSGRPPSWIIGKTRFFEKTFALVY